MFYKVLMHMTVIPMIATWLVTGVATAAESCTARSDARTVALLELYTSEGCSSCPPADRWLRSLTTSGQVPERLVPLALHVDYWNYLGWRDPFSQALFSQRQRVLGQHNRSRSIYTPEFFLNGTEYRGWSHKDLSAQLARINATPAQASIELSLDRMTPDAHAFSASGEIRVRNATERSQADVFFALYENGLSNRIGAGENDGRTLNHDFVVRRLLGPYTVKHMGATRVQSRIPVQAGWKKVDLGVAAFVQNRVTGAVLQALALPVCVESRQ